VVEGTFEHKYSAEANRRIEGLAQSARSSVDADALTTNSTYGRLDRVLTAEDTDTTPTPTYRLLTHLAVVDRSDERLTG